MTTIQRLVIALFCSVAFVACSNAETQPRAATAAALSPPVATWTGGALTRDELAAHTTPAIRALDADYARRRHQIERAAVNELLQARLLAEAADARGVTVERMREEVLASVSVTAAEIRAVYDESVAAHGVSYAEAKPVIAQELRSQREQAALDAVVAQLQASANARIRLEAPPQARVALDLEGRPSRGPDDARVTIVLFEDFECPYCADIRGSVEALLNAFPSELRVVFMHYPLSFHKAGQAAAVVAACAHRQGAFWAMYDQLFDNAQRLSNSRSAMLEHATAIGLDEGAFLACLDDPETRDLVDDDIDQAEEAGVEGTPTVVVNGVLHEGLPSIAELGTWMR